MNFLTKLPTKGKTNLRGFKITRKKLSANRISELKYPGSKPREKRKVLKAYDERIKNVIKQYKEGRITLKRYWAKIVKLKLDFGFEHLYQR